MITDIIQYLKDSLKEVIKDSEKSVYRLEQCGKNEIEIWMDRPVTDEEFKAFRAKNIDSDQDDFTLILHYSKP